MKTELVPMLPCPINFVIGALCLYNLPFSRGDGGAQITITDSSDDGCGVVAIVRIIWFWWWSLVCSLCFKHRFTGRFMVSRNGVRGFLFEGSCQDSPVGGNMVGSTFLTVGP